MIALPDVSGEAGQAPQEADAQVGHADPRTARGLPPRRSTRARGQPSTPSSTSRVDRARSAVGTAQSTAAGHKQATAMKPVS